MTAIPNTVPKFLWHFSKRYAFHLALFVFVALFWATNMSLSPYMIKLIIDTVAEASVTSENLFAAVGLPAIGYILLSLLLGAVFRFHDWVTLNTFPKMKSEIAQEMFDYIESHSYSFFQHN